MKEAGSPLSLPYRVTKVLPGEDPQALKDKWDWDEQRGQERVSWCGHSVNGR